MKLVCKLPPKVAMAASRTALKVSKHSPEILLGVGIASGVAATVFACKATLHLEEVLDKHQEVMDKISEVSSDESYPEYTPEKAAKDKYIQTVKTVVGIGKLYWPAITLGIFSISCLIGGHHILSKRNAALTVAYSAVQKAYADYRKRVAEEIGDERELELYSGVHETYDEKVDKNGKVRKVNEKKELGRAYSPYARVFDESSRWFKRNADMNKMFLMSQMSAANTRLRLQGHLFLNEVYDMLDIPRCPMGQMVGWVYGSATGDSIVDFGLKDLEKEGVRDFINGYEKAVWLDFNVDGVIYDLI